MFEGFTLETVATPEQPVRVRHGGSGPPLLLLHGAPETGAMWWGQAEALARDFTVYVPDLRGYGGSGKPKTTADHEPYSKRAMNRDLIAMMRHFGHQRFHVAGHDRGGRCAYRMALDTPEAVDKLIILDIIPTAEAYARVDYAFASFHWLWFLLAQPAPWAENMFEGDKALMLLGKVRTLVPDAVYEEYRHYLSMPETMHAMCEDYRAQVQIDRAIDEGVMASGQKIAAPTLVLWGRTGALDRFDPLSIWQRWCVEARGHAIDCGHFVPEEAPAETLAAMQAFLKG